MSFCLVLYTDHFCVRVICILHINTYLCYPVVNVVKCTVIGSYVTAQGNSANRHSIYPFSMSSQ